MAEKSGKRQVVVRVDAETHDRWTAAAAGRIVSLNALIIDAVERELGMGNIVRSRTNPDLVGAVMRRQPKSKGKGKAKRPRTELCEHRRRPDEFCSRCDA